MPRFFRPLIPLLLLVLTLSAASPPATFASPARAWVSTQAAAQATPGPIVKQAFDLLMDRFVIPPSSADVLRGGWEEGLNALKAKDVQDLPKEAPAFGGGREADWQLFVGRYPALSEASKGKLEHTDLDRAIVAGMAASVHEAHTYYLNPEAYRFYLSQIRNDVRYAGIGASFNPDRVVVEVFEGTPAHAGGLRLGDEVIAIDDQSVEGLPSAEVSTRARGIAGTPVKLTIRRQGTPEPTTITMIRAEIKLNWLVRQITEDGVGYLRLRAFPTPDALSAFRQAIDEFRTANIRALVIDVRRNGGGSVDTGIEIASSFIRHGPLFKQVDRRGGERTVTAFGDYWDRDIPMAILTDASSGSMSEILASALQENGVARVIGTKTAGAVAGTNIYPLADGSGVAVTGLLIKSGQGKTLNGVGLEPDQQVELDVQRLRAGQDSQLDTAFDYVRQEAAARDAARAAHLAPARAPAEVIAPSYALPPAA